MREHKERERDDKVQQELGDKVRQGLGGQGGLKVRDEVLGGRVRDVGRERGKELGEVRGGERGGELCKEL